MRHFPSCLLVFWLLFLLFLVLVFLEKIYSPAWSFRHKQVLLCVVLLLHLGPSTWIERSFSLVWA